MKKAFFCVLCAAVSLCARAQGVDPLEPPDLSRYLRWGPLRARPGLLLSNIGYDDNVFYRTAASVDSNGNPLPREGDYTATVSPRLEGLVLFGRRAFLTFTEQVDLVLYSHYGGLNYANQLGSGRVTIPLRKIGFYGDFAFNITQERPADQIDARLTVREQRYGGGIIVKFGWRTDATLGVLQRKLSNTDPDDPLIAPRLDRVETGTELLARYLLVGRTRFTLYSHDKSIDYDDPFYPPGDPSAPNRNATERRILPGFEFGEGGRLSGAIAAGWSRLDSKAPSLPDYSGLVGAAKLGYRFGAGTTLMLDGRRDVGFAVWEDTRYYLLTGYGLRVIQYFNRLIGAEAGAARGRLLFPKPTDREDLQRQLDAGVRLRLFENNLGRRVEYILRITRWRIDSTIDGYDQSRTTFGFNVVLGY